MEVIARGDCIALERVKSQGSLPIYFHGNKYILTVIDCFTRYAIAVPLRDQSLKINRS